MGAWDRDAESAGEEACKAEDWRFILDRLAQEKTRRAV